MATWTALNSPGTGKVRNRRMRHRTLTDTRVILYDLTVLQKEGDDPKSAILYYYPETINETELCNLFGQLMGMVDIFEDHMNTPPRSIYLDRGMYVFKHLKEYRLVLGSTNSQNEAAMLQQLELLYQVFCLLQGNLKDIKKNIVSKDQRDFLLQLRCVLDSYLPLCFQYDSVIEPSLLTVPSFQIPKTDSTIFMEVVTLLETSQRRPGVLGGCTLFKNKVVYSQLPLQLTRVLTAIHADLHHLQCESVDIGSVPEGGSLTKLYLSFDDYTQLYDSLLLPNSQHYSSSEFAISPSPSTSHTVPSGNAAAANQQTKQNPSNVPKNFEVKSHESENEGDLLLRGDNSESEDKSSLDTALAEKTKARATYFTLISDSSFAPDLEQSTISSKDAKSLRTASISLDVGETWPVINVRANSKDGEKGPVQPEATSNKKPSSTAVSNNAKNEKMVIEFKNKKRNPVKSTKTVSSKTDGVKTDSKETTASDSSVEDKSITSKKQEVSLEACFLNDENMLYGSMLSKLSKESGQNSTKPPFTPKTSLPECSTCIGEECSLILYVQNNSDSSSMLLMEPSACNMEAIQTLWKLILPKLGNLDYHFKKIDQLPKTDSVRKHVMKSIVLDNLKKQLTGYERQKHPLVDAELEKMLLDIHYTFESYPTAMDITLGSHCACTYGHRNPGMEAFFQKSFEKSLAFSPQASNMIIIMETLARIHLKEDKDLVLV